MVIGGTVFHNIDEKLSENNIKTVLCALGQLVGGAIQIIVVIVILIV